MQLRIEAQSRYLQKIVEEQQKSSDPQGDELAACIPSITHLPHSFNSEAISSAPCDLDVASESGRLHVGVDHGSSILDKHLQTINMKQEMSERELVHLPYHVPIPIHNNYASCMEACPENQGIESHSAYALDGGMMMSAARIPPPHEYTSPESLVPFTSKRLSNASTTNDGEFIMHSDTFSKMDGWRQSQSLPHIQHAAPQYWSSVMPLYHVDSHQPLEPRHDEQSDVPSQNLSLYYHNSNDRISDPNNFSSQ